MGMTKPTTAMVMASRFNQLGYTSLKRSLSIPGQWSTGLCDCTTDMSLCCLTCWCPCITFGQNTEIIDKGSSSCGVNGALYGIIGVISGLHFVYACIYRGRLKRQFDITISPMEDLCTHFWCHPCALCQEHRELQHQGYDVPLGWIGNLEKRNSEAGSYNPPMVPNSMSR